MNSPPAIRNPTDQRAEAIQDYLATLPPTTPLGAFHGGIVVKVDDTWLVGILTNAEDGYDNYVSWLQCATDDYRRWELTHTEELFTRDGTRIEAIHCERAAA